MLEHQLNTTKDFSSLSVFVGQNSDRILFVKYDLPKQVCGNRSRFTNLTRHLTDYKAILFECEDHFLLEFPEREHDQTLIDVDDLTIS
jgi:hypothetical protein